MAASGINACVLLEQEVDWGGAALVDHSSRRIHELKVGSLSFFNLFHPSKLNSASKLTPSLAAGKEEIRLRVGMCECMEASS
jgi:hypothetical protein